jgi:hypothetical protein
MVLNVNKEVYEKLGLDGKPSAFNGKTCSRYIVTLDVTAPYFKPNKNNYKRVEWCFRNRLGLTFDFHVTWVPFGEDF